ncbi:MAG: hypothetical protein JST16_08805 [Bdellovibrionales bacterium]|nr:hypothetical protein [Bdellovibrionales bacterium]
MKYLLGFTLVLATTAVYARPYNYQDIPVGERAFGMGHAASAVEGSDTGVMYTNPAVLGLSTHSQVSASLSAFSRIDTRTGKYVSVFESAHDNVSRTGFFAVPSLVGGHVKTGNWVWGGTILVPDSFENSGTLEIDSDHIGSFESNEKAYWYGAFGARQWGNHAFGISLFYADRTTIEKFQFVTRSSSRIRLFESTLGTNAFVLLLGGTYKVSDAWRLSYGVRLPPYLLGGEAATVDVASDVAGVTYNKGDPNFYPMPLKATVGAAWRPEDWILVAADLHVYSGLHGYAALTGTPQFKMAAKPIANISLGTEVRPFQHFGFRAGFFSNFSAAEKTPRYLTAIGDKVHMFGGTLAVLFTKDQGSISVGGFLQGGQGSSPSISENSGDIVPRSNYFYGFVVGSSYRF